jgi:quinol monooxygenase YgiN
MSEYMRLFQSAVYPGDVDEVRRLFAEDVKPVFDNAEGCLGIDLLVSTEPNAGGLVEGAAVSRWRSLDALEHALESREVQEAGVRILQVLRQEPVTRTFEILA